MPRSPQKRPSQQRHSRKRPRRMANRQYQRSELAILNALLAASSSGHAPAFPPDHSLYRLKISELSRLSQVSRATIYRHHSKVPTILIDLEDFLLHGYRRHLRPILRQGRATPRELYLEMLLFILRYRPFFQILVIFGRTHFLEFQVRSLLPIIVKSSKFHHKTPLFFKLYEKRIATLLEIWILHDFEPPPSVIVADILYLTETFPAYFRSINRRLPPAPHPPRPPHLHPLN